MDFVSRRNGRVTKDVWQPEAVFLVMASKEKLKHTVCIGFYKQNKMDCDEIDGCTERWMIGSDGRSSTVY